MRLSEKEKLYRHHSGRVERGASPAEQEESLDFLAKLADKKDGLPEHIAPKLLCALFNASKDNLRPLADRANALHVLVKLLERPAAFPLFSSTGRHKLIDKGVIDLFAEVVVGTSNELREECARGARLIGGCCHGCRKRICEAELDNGIMQQMRDGGFDASAEATRGAVGAITTLIWKKQQSVGQVLVDQAEARDIVVPALSRALITHGAADDEIGQIAMPVLLRITDCDQMMVSNHELLNYLVTIISSNKMQLAKLALWLLNRLSQIATSVHIRPLIAQPGFMPYLAYWLHGPDDMAIAAESLLWKIAAERSSVYTAIVLTNQTLISTLAASIRLDELWRGRAAVMMFSKILNATTLAGISSNSQYILGFGFLPRLVQYVARLDANDVIVATARNALYRVHSVHPEWSGKMHESGASLPPLQMTMRLRAERPGQWYIYDEDCDEI